MAESGSSSGKTRIVEPTHGRLLFRRSNGPKKESRPWVGSTGRLYKKTRARRLCRARGVTVPRDRLLATGTGNGGHLGDDLAIDHRQPVARGAIRQAHGGFLPVVAIGHVVGDGHVLAAQRDALAGFAVGAQGPGGAVRIPVGHVPGHGARGRRSAGGGVAAPL